MDDALSLGVLQGRSGPFAGVAIPIPPGGLMLGREAPGADRLAFDPDSDVSRDHCSVRFDAVRRCFVVIDHGSSNGTFLLPQGQRLANRQEQVCPPGQQIRLGRENVFELALQRVAPAPEPQAARPPSRVATSYSPGGLPLLQDNQRLDLQTLRVPFERLYLGFVLVPTGLAVLGLLVALGMLFVEPSAVLPVLMMVGLWGGGFALLTWVAWKLTLAHLVGHSIQVGPDQYPQIHALVTRASEIMNVVPPTVLILQGHGLFELFAARRFSRRGVLIITSNMLDDLTENGSSREFMFFVGRQLGLIASGYFDGWFFKHTLGQFALFFHPAWKRRCHLTADRIGLLVTGDPVAAERALLILAAGMAVAANTRMDALRQQREQVLSSGWSWLALSLSSYPFMVDRIVRMREFAEEATRRGLPSNAPTAVAALRIEHRPIRALPIIIVHGHDRVARLELENFLRRSLPHVEPILMIDESDSAATLPEKFERLGRGAKGVLALLTPDDVAMAQSDGQARFRARQNVIGELFYFWGLLGRQRLLLLTRGELEIPSDLSGVGVHRFAASPIECSESVRQFVAGLEVM